MKSYKCIVIGSGPGGATVASEIAKTGADVLMVERGKFQSLSKQQEYTSREINTKYKNGGLTPAFCKPIINYAEGCCVGGGSEINSGLFHEVPEEILQSWEKKNSINFDRGELREAYNDVKSRLNISYMPKSEMPKASTILMDGSKKLGWECNEIPRWYSYDDGSNGKRMTMTETYIPDFVENGGEILESYKVTKIRKEAKKQNIVEICGPNKEEIKVKSDYIVISAGAIDTPFLLLQSGYKKNVGEGLKMHPSFKFTAMFSDEINDNNMGVPVHQVKEFSPKISMGCSISNKQFIALGLNDSNNMEYLDSWKKMANYYSMISPIGSGSVRKIIGINSPVVNYKLTREDKKNTIEGAKLLGRLLFKAGAKKLFPSIAQNILFENESQLNSLNNINFSYYNLMTIHLFSSAQIGGNKKTSVVNPEGHLWEDDTIFISDSSILCDSPTVNPQGTVMAFAKMNAKYIVNKIKNGI